MTNRELREARKRIRKQSTHVSLVTRKELAKQVRRAEVDTLHREKRRDWLRYMNGQSVIKPMYTLSGAK